MLHELKMKLPKMDRMYNEDPFLLAGFGINSYFDIMLSLGYMFSVISFMMVPAMYNYSHNN